MSNRLPIAYVTSVNPEKVNCVGNILRGMFTVVPVKVVQVIDQPIGLGEITNTCRERMRDIKISGGDIIVSIESGWVAKDGVNCDMVVVAIKRGGVVVEGQSDTRPFPRQLSTAKLSRAIDHRVVSIWFKHMEGNGKRYSRTDQINVALKGALEKLHLLDHHEQ